MLPRIAEVILVVAMAWMVSGWFTGGSMPNAPAPGLGGMGTSATGPSAQAIASVPLFGESASTQTSPATPVATSHLSIQLLGTVVAGRHSAAVVALRAGAEQKVFLLGQAIEPGVTLKTVEPMAIVIDNRGRMERIAMAKPSLSMAPSLPGSTASDRSHIDISRANLNTQLQNLPKLLTQARAIQFQLDGKPDGIMIDDIVPGSFYTKVGLRDGDVIRSINGRRIRLMAEGIQMFQSLKDQRSIDIEIAHGRTIRHLHFTIQ